MDDNVDFERFAEDIFAWLWLHFKFSPRRVPDPQRKPNTYAPTTILRAVARAVNLNQILCRKLLYRLFEIEVRTSPALLESEDNLYVYISELIETIFQRSEKGATYDVFTQVIQSLTVPAEMVLYLQSRSLIDDMWCIPGLWYRYFNSHLSEEFVERGGIEKLQEKCDQTSDVSANLNTFMTRHFMPYTGDDLYEVYKEFVANCQNRDSGTENAESSRFLEKFMENTKEYKNYRGYLWEYHPRFELFPIHLKVAEDIFKNPAESEAFLTVSSKGLSRDARKLQKHIKLKSIWLLFHQILLNDPVARAEAEAEARDLAEAAAAIEAAAGSDEEAAIEAAAAGSDEETAIEAAAGNDEDSAIKAAAESDEEAAIDATTGSDKEAGVEEETAAESEETRIKKRKAVIIEFLRRKLRENISATPKKAEIENDNVSPVERKPQEHIKLKSIWSRYHYTLQMRDEAAVGREVEAVGREVEALDIHEAAVGREVEAVGRHEAAVGGEVDAVSREVAADAEQCKLLTESSTASREERLPVSENSPVQKGKFRSKDSMKSTEEKAEKKDCLVSKKEISSKQLRRLKKKQKVKEKYDPKPKDRTVVDKDCLISKEEKLTDKVSSPVFEKGKSTLEEGSEPKITETSRQSPKEKTTKDKDLVSKQEKSTKKESSQMSQEVKLAIKEIPGSQKTKDGKLDVEVSVRPKQRTVQDENNPVSKEEKLLEKQDSPVSEKKKSSTQGTPEPKKTKDGKLKINPKSKKGTMQEKNSLMTAKGESPNEKVAPKYYQNIELAHHLEKLFFTQRNYKDETSAVEDDDSIAEVDDLVSIVGELSPEARRMSRTERSSISTEQLKEPKMELSPETKQFLDRLAEDVFSNLCKLFQVPAQFFHKPESQPNVYPDDLLEAVTRSVCANQLSNRPWVYKFFTEAMKDSDFNFLESPSKTIILMSDAILDLINMSKTEKTTIHHMFIDSLTIPIELILFLASRGIETHTEYFPVCWKVFATFELMKVLSKCGGFYGLRESCDSLRYTEGLLEPFVTAKCLKYNGEELWEMFSVWLFEDSYAEQQKEIADSYLVGLIPKETTITKTTFKHKKKKGKRKK